MNDIIEYIKNETNIEDLKASIMNILEVYRQLFNEAQQDKASLEFIINNFIKNTDFEYYEKPKISIIVPVYNNYLYTKCLLNSIYKNTKDIEYEVIIADDNSDDETKNISKNFENIVHIKNTTGHKGFLYNVKNAIQHARGEYIFLMNNDMIVCKNYLTELLNVIENDNSIGIAGSKTLDVNNKIQECGVKINKKGMFYLGVDEEPNYKDDCSYVECDYCSGCAILFKKEIWNKSGGFDTNYEPAYCEDSDFALNLKHNFGLKSVCVPKSKIYHFKSKTYKNHNASDNMNYFFNKWDKYITIPTNKD